MYVCMYFICRLCLHEISDQVVDQSISFSFEGSVDQLWSLSVPYPRLCGGEDEKREERGREGDTERRGRERGRGREEVREGGEGNTECSAVNHEFFFSLQRKDIPSYSVPSSV